VYDGDVGEAKARYGSAIEAYLEMRDYEAAVKTSRKLIRVAPDVARARFTLAFLLIGLGEVEEAKKQLLWYVDAVRAAGAADFAVPRLQLLAHATSDEGTRVLIETLILDLGGKLTRPVAPMRSFDGMARWERVLDTVLKDARA
jgi:predicted Zn-dependent protease